MTLHITRHAIQRFQERIANLPDERVVAALDTPTVRMAAEFGAPYVRLPSRHRIVLEGHSIVTVLPPDENLRCLGRRRP